jgi:hypothetical protein
MHPLQGLSEERRRSGKTFASGSTPHAGSERAQTLARKRGEGDFSGCDQIAAGFISRL